MTDSIEESILYSFSSFIAYQLADYKNRLKRGIHNEFMDMNSIAIHCFVLLASFLKDMIYLVRL